MPSVKKHRASLPGPAARRNRKLPKCGAMKITPRPSARVPQRNQMSMCERAYEQIENLIVNCRLRPGGFLAMQDLQDLTGLGRTPIHQAINRLAADTLVIIIPRHGVRIAPIDLARERILLRLRRDIERFVIRLVAERSGPSHHHQLLHLQRLLCDRRKTMTVNEFNTFDRRFDRLIMVAANEPFLDHTLRPLHTIFRRIGWIYHTRIAGNINPAKTIDCHLAILDAIATHRIDKAVAASDKLIDFVDGMFDAIENEIDPVLLDCSLEPLVTSS